MYCLCSRFTGKMEVTSYHPDSGAEYGRKSIDLRQKNGLYVYDISRLINY